jgi:deazaflavin-dependent oxidoreductase (nitroreductase family)
MIFMAIWAFIYRLTGGMLLGSMGLGSPLLLLDTVGRKTGKRRTVPLVYFVDDGRYIITASKGGSDSNPGWYYNLRANPQTTIQVKNKKLTVTASEATPEERTRLWARLVAQSPQFKNYETKTKRLIPMMILKP